MLPDEGNDYGRNVPCTVPLPAPELISRCASTHPLGILLLLFRNNTIIIFKILILFAIYTTYTLRIRF